ncbi:MAG: helix-turn-helix domain-containing protein [Lachnospiraceae bacterium]|nr:helix-turn-helix domain-containing protein [Lachnospiraceae bacterium]
MNLGESIKELRTKHNMTQEECAVKYNVTRQTVSNWENGKSIPDLEILLKFSDDFSITVDSLLREDIEAVKKNDKERHIWKKVVLALVAVLIIFSCIFFYQRKQFLDSIKVDLKMEDSISKKMSSADSPLILREGYFKISKNAVLKLDSNCSTDDGNIEILIKDSSGKEVYQREGDDFKDKQELRLSADSYNIQIMVKDFDSGLVSLDYNLKIKN